MEMDITRRQFVKGLAAAGAVAGLSRAGLSLAASRPADEINLALIGAGAQGRNLMMLCTKIPGVRFRAVCDIWPYHQRYASAILGRLGQPVNVYEDYGDLLAKEKGLTAAVVATPDFVHAEQTVACLKAGLHVYCEKALGHPLEQAATIVEASRQTDKLVQVGTHRRSLPWYQWAHKLVTEDKVLGRVTNVYAHWHRPMRGEGTWPFNEALPVETLKRYGYASMEELRNWRWWWKYGGGPMGDVGSHQMDVLNWFVGTPPSTVQASAGLDYYKGGDCYDTVQALYEYRTPAGPVRGMYEMLSTTRIGGMYEIIRGDQRTLVLSADPQECYLIAEEGVKPLDWQDAAPKMERMGRRAFRLVLPQEMLSEAEGTEQQRATDSGPYKPMHLFHLENFFAAIRGQAKLTCPAEIAYATLATALKANEAAETGRKLEIELPDPEVG